MLKEGKLIIGAELTLKGLKKGNVTKVFLAVNTDLDTKDDVKTYASMNGVEVVELDVTNEELGTVCQKPFSISVLGVKK